MKMRNVLLGTTTAVGLVFAIGGTNSANAAVSLALGLTMDSSGSIGAANWDLQLQGYANALSALLPTDGSVMLEINRFSGSTSTIFAPTIINDAGDIAAVVAALTGIPFPGGGTNIGVGIDNSRTSLDAALALLNPADIDPGLRKVIDVSTDGVGSLGTSVADATAAGYVINCLGVGGGANCDFATGFTQTVGNFADFEAAITTKLRREIIGDEVPEPATLAILGIGLAALGAVRRRRN